MNNRHGLKTRIAQKPGLTWAKAAQLLGVASLVSVLQMLSAPAAFAQATVALAQTPLLALKSTPGLVMLTMSRDHRLFYAAYRDNSDIDGDGAIDVGFKPGINYYGYFVSDRCYAYDTANQRFSPKSIASSTDGCKTAPSGARWHGNWMNWATTSRMDALRRVLYGGYRVSDPSVGVTVLEGANVPSDSHIWGKEFRPPSGASTSDGPDTYKIDFYTPLAAPSSAATKQHSFMVRSDPVAYNVLTLNAPYLRIAANVSRDKGRVWNWVASERPVGAATTFDGATTNVLGTSSFRIRVETCVPIGGSVESTCRNYGTAAVPVWKPKGLLHDYGDQDRLKFGLLTGSYLNNYSGGVVRKDIGTFNDEIEADGRFKSSVNGIVSSINNIRTFGFYETTPSDAAYQQAPAGGTYEYLCGFYYASLRDQGKCHMWGAPVGEMMYEGLRYFNAGASTSGTAAPTSAYIANVANAASPDSKLGLPTKTTWLNPYRSKASGGSPICSRPIQMVIADTLTSFDTDQLPGAEAIFPVPAGGSAPLQGTDKTLPGLNVALEADTIWASEFTSPKLFFVGESGANKNGNPTEKTVTSFSNIRGHAPDETLSQGGFYAAGVARYGKETGVKVGPGGAVKSVQTPVDTIAVALGVVVPPMTLSYGGRTVTVVPVLKTVAGTGVNPFDGSGAGPVPYQETGAITAFFVDRIANTSAANLDASVNSGLPYARYLVSFSNAGQGTDNETDLSAYYILRIDPAKPDRLLVEIDHFYEAAGRISTMGYVISGTTTDGLYMELRKIGDTGNTINYLDTRPGQLPAPGAYPFRKNPAPLPLGVANPSSTGATPQVSRSFVLGAAGAAFGSYIPHDVLWYAAKYGGPKDKSGEPLNYFKVTNPANLPAQAEKAFRAAAALASVASTSVVGVGQRSLGTAAIYQANYDSLTWSSRLYAFGVANSGVVSNSTLWEASSLIPAPSGRNKLFLGRGGALTPVKLTSGNYAGLQPAEKVDFGDALTYEYLLGDKTQEERNGGAFRNRGTSEKSTAPADGFGSVLGDIVNSDPQIISKKDYGFSAGDATYATFLADVTVFGTPAVPIESLAVGANEGFFHIFDASPANPRTTGGNELLGFMPQAARTNVKDLASPNYSHRYFVDGAIGLGHAKIGASVSGCATSSWCTVAVAAGGAGAKTVFAINTTFKTYSASNILWEINENTATLKPGILGNVVGRPAIGKLKNGTWVAVFGNGYNNSAAGTVAGTTGTANLIVVELATGNILAQIATNNSIVANGLGSTEIVKSSNGFKDTIDYVYGADFKGNIWRFDLSDSNVSSWPTTAALVYKTPSGRPITGEIKVGDATGNVAIAGGKMIYFGTGSYLTATDPADTTPQALYGIYDDLLWTLNNSPSIANDSKLVSMGITMPSALSDVRSTSAGSTPWYNQTGKKGWTLPLTGTNVAPGERVIAPPVRYTVPGKVDAFLFTSIVPGTDDCIAGVDAWITGIDAMTGAYTQVFDKLLPNSVKVTGGSPRGVFVLQDGGDPTLYISQTIFNGSVSTTSFETTVGGQQSVSINGTVGQTQVLGIKLTKATPVASIGRQSWRQLK